MCISNHHQGQKCDSSRQQNPDSVFACALAASDGAPTAEQLIGVVQSPASNSAGFPGIYATSLSQQPFLGKRYVLVNTQWANRGEIAAVDLQSGQVTPLGSQVLRPDSWTLLACQEGVCDLNSLLRSSL